MEQGEAWGSLPGGQGDTPPSQPECPPRGHPGTSYSGTGHEYADSPSLPSGCSPRVEMESGPLPTDSHLWSRLASALTTPRSGACWPAPWGDPPTKVARSAVYVYRSCWAGLRMCPGLAGPLTPAAITCLVAPFWAGRHQPPQGPRQPWGLEGPPGGCGQGRPFSA